MCVCVCVVIELVGLLCVGLLHLITLFRVMIPIQRCVQAKVKKE